MKTIPRPAEWIAIATAICGIAGTSAALALPLAYPNMTPLTWRLIFWPSVTVLGLALVLGLLEVLRTMRSNVGKAEPLKAPTQSPITDVERKRRSTIIGELSREYWSTHGPAPAIGAAPDNWINQRLKELNESWSVSSGNHTFSNVGVHDFRIGIAMPGGKGNTLENITIVNSDTGIDLTDGERNNLKRVTIANQPSKSGK